MKFTGLSTTDARRIAIDILEACEETHYPHKFIKQLESNIEDLQYLVF